MIILWIFISAIVILGEKIILEQASSMKAFLWANIADFSAMNIAEYKFNLTVKAGIAIAKANSTGLQLFNQALIALDSDKSSSSRIDFYNDHLEKTNRLYFEVAGSLSDALARGEFYLVYQPVIDLKTDKVSSVEALIRWDRGDRVAVGPSLFIEVAEQIGLITQISKWVVTTSANQLKKWQDMGWNLKLSVNLTSQEINDDQFRFWMADYLSGLDLKPGTFGLEITERVITNDSKKLATVIAQLQKSGYYVAIDDFGTGYNSLATIGQVNLDVIKIDRYFTSRLHLDNIVIIVSHIIKAAHQAGKIIVVEGVETREQLHILKKLKADKIQGYYYAKPLSVLELNDYLESRTPS